MKCMRTLLILGVLGWTSGSEDLKRSSLYYGVASVSSGEGTECRSQLRELAQNLESGTRWAVKMLDSSGSPGTGLYYGNVYWLGNRQQCEDTVKLPVIPTSTLAGPITVETDADKPPFPVAYYAVYFAHNSDIMFKTHLGNDYRMTLGLCLPSSCDEMEVSDVCQEYFDTNLLQYLRIYNTTFVVESTKKVFDDYSWLDDFSTVLLGIILIATIIMCIFATVHEIYVYRPMIASKKKSSTKAKKNNSKSDKNKYTLENSPKISKYHLIINCFSMARNRKIIFSSISNPNSIKCIHGIRVISLMYIVAGHSVLFHQFFIYNRTYPFSISTQLIPQIFANSHFAVDSFLCLGGFLLSYLFFSAEKNSKNVSKNGFVRVRNYFTGIINRYIRITPSYVVAVLIAVVIANWRIRSMPFWQSERADELCPKYWWRNILYINNFYPYNEICLPWSWFLSSDFQYFIISSGLLMLSTIYFNVAAGLFTGLFMFGIIYLAYITYVTGYIPILDNLQYFKFLFYYSPLVRMNVYLVGVIAGYILAKYDRKLELSKPLKCISWIIWGIMMLTLFFAFGDLHMSLTASMFYVAFSRVVWAVCNMWIVIACETGNAVILNKILSAQVWFPLSRISYWCYLINPVVVFLISSYNEQTIESAINTVIISVPGLFMWTLIVSFIFTLIFDSPVINMLKLVKGRSGNRQMKSKNDIDTDNNITAAPVTESTEDLKT